MRSMSWIELNKMQTYGWHSFSVKTIQKKLRREISEKVQNKYQITKIILKFHHFLYRIIINIHFFCFLFLAGVTYPFFLDVFSTDSVSISFHHVAFGELAWNRNPKIQGEKRKKKIVNKEKEMNKSKQGMRITEKQKIDEQFKMMVAVSTHFVTEKKKKAENTQRTMVT